MGVRYVLGGVVRVSCFAACNLGGANVKDVQETVLKTKIHYSVDPSLLQAWRIHCGGSPNIQELRRCVWQIQQH